MCLLQLASRDAAVVVDLCAWFDSSDEMATGGARPSLSIGLDGSGDGGSEGGGWKAGGTGRLEALDGLLAATLLREDVLKVARPTLPRPPNLHGFVSEWIVP